MKSSYSHRGFSIVKLRKNNTIKTLKDKRLVVWNENVIQQVFFCRKANEDKHKGEMKNVYFERNGKL